jgi:uncharacterized protein GlcG (DUF336 family)
MQITSQQAAMMLVAATASASAIGVPMNIAVLDGGAHLKAFVRMDGAVLGSIDIALKAATNDVLVVFAGGIPIKGTDGSVIGAVGVSGGAVDQDYAVAQAAAGAA